MSIIYVLVSLFCCIFSTTAELEIVTDDELVNLIKTEKYVVVLFTKDDCEQCDRYESELIHLREDLVDALNAWVVKAVGSQLVRAYNPSKEPALVFLRHGVPLIYDGPLNDELILHTFVDNKEPTVRELSDSDFEHLTQASSGATTGDWFVMFYGNDCVDCQRLQARWEAVGAKLKTRLNVARVNKQTTGAATGRRFGVRSVPAFILFRQGKMYRYNIPNYDVPSFVAFAVDWYKNARMEIVPAPKSPFDDLTQMVADHVRDNLLLWQAGGGVAFLLLLWLLYRRLARSGPRARPPAKAKKSK
ncbi:thioredoxin domain-containing protein [Bacillus rossius redtenbacheri]|uniref:thioredoxin domain-containing protein n=1 Tax=Bacillus rossius redtenbacheri TaxID=93214 RepID=UPI002FDD35DC